MFNSIFQLSYTHYICLIFFFISLMFYCFDWTIYFFHSSSFLPSPLSPSLIFIQLKTNSSLIQYTLVTVSPTPPSSFSRYWICPKKKKRFFLEIHCSMSMCVCSRLCACTHAWVYTSYTWDEYSVQRVQKRTLDPLWLEKQIVWSY